MRSKKILILQGHPAADSYCEALGQAYLAGAGGPSDRVRYLALRDLTFDPVLHTSQALKQPLEPDLLAAQEALAWAEHWVLVYPTWWGSVPALMKGFFDRTLTQGFAFRYQPQQILWEKLLSGRTAHIVTTMNTPPVFYQLLYADSGIKLLTHSVLGFCGVSTTKVTRIGAVRHFSDVKRQRWLEKLERYGRYNF
jgi:putative NADPH-quinone reductase